MGLLMMMVGKPKFGILDFIELRLHKIYILGEFGHSKLAPAGRFLHRISTASEKLGKIKLIIWEFLF